MEEAIPLLLEGVGEAESFVELGVEGVVRAEPGLDHEEPRRARSVPVDQRYFVVGIGLIALLCGEREGEDLQGGEGGRFCEAAAE